MSPIRLLLVAFLAAMSATLVVQADDPIAQTGANDFVIDADHPAPKAELEYLGKRYKEFKAAIPENYGVQVKMLTFGAGGGTKVIRYAESLTPLNPAGKPDGIAYEWNDWYHHHIRRTEYKDGVKHGLETLYFPNGKAPVPQTEITWVNGVLQGPKKSYYPDGKIASESTFVDGEISGESKSWGKTGSLSRIATFKAGKRHGTVTDYWPDRPDTVKREINYQDGQVHGLAREYYANGQVKWERPFVNNKQHGIEKQYDADGAVLKTKYWIDGEEVEEDVYTAAIK